MRSIGRPPRRTYVPYKGGADAITGLLGGHIHALVAAEFPPYAASGQVRLLAESGPDKLQDFPNVPTYRELGFPVSVPIFYGIAGPAGMPSDAVAHATLTELFPSRQIVAIPAADFVWGLGACHCATQQQPALVSA